MSESKLPDKLEVNMKASGEVSEDLRPAVSTAEAEGQSYSEDFWTRNGLTWASFRKAQSGTEIVELKRTMKKRHLRMIAMGGAIGAGFFVGSGLALNEGGPGSVFLCFSIIGVMMFNIVYALGEMSVLYPISGSFCTLTIRFVDPSWGFAMSWNYVLQWAVTLPYELTVCGLTIKYWNAEISVGVWIAVFLAAIIFVNMFGSLGYAEEEFWASAIKLVTIIVFMIICLVLVLGGGPSDGRYDHYWGARYWHDPGPFRNGLKGFCSVFVVAASAFSGTELVGLAAAESKNPTKLLPGAIKQVFWRITLFYVLGLFFIGLLINSNDPALLSGTGYVDIKASPFVLVAHYAALPHLDDVLNVVILISVLSIGVSSVYGGSRALTALAQMGYAPKIFSFIDRAGRPTPSVVVITAFGLLAFANLNTQGIVVFEWLLALSGLGVLFTWASICLAHIRFRQAWKYNGHTTDELPFKAVGGVYGSWFGLILCIIVLVAQFYVAIAAPIGESGLGSVTTFFQAYLAAPIVLVFWAGAYLWKRKGWLRIADIDIDTDRREQDWEEIRAIRKEKATWPFWRRTWDMFF